MTYQRHKHTGEEEFSEEFMAMLTRLNNEIVLSGEAFEGGVFYRHKHEFTTNMSEPAVDVMRHKRINLNNAFTGKSHYLEVGFNAGHSTFFALQCNQTMKVTSNDICFHPYTEPCVGVLQSFYPDRLRFLKGDSRIVIPMHYKELADVDLIHIDGGHGFDTCLIDMYHAVTLPKNKGVVRHLIIDDIQLPAIQKVIAEFINLGFIEGETMGGSWLAGESYKFNNGYYKIL